jgi:hypothetical protein
MRRTQLIFYATTEDLAPIVRFVESQADIKYVRAGMQQTPAPVVYKSAFELPNFGHVPSGDAAREPVYLIVQGSHEIAVETIPQKRGGVLYGIYPKLNPSVSFSSGGVFDSRHIINGELSTAATTPVSVELYELFERPIRKAFRNVKGMRVGAAAYAALQAGARLTDAADRAPDYDLRP